MRLSNILWPKAEAIYAGNPYFESWKRSSRVALGGTAIVGVGLVLGATGLSVEGGIADAIGAFVLIGGVANAALDSSSEWVPTDGHEPNESSANQSSQ